MANGKQYSIAAPVSGQPRRLRHRVVSNFGWSLINQISARSLFFLANIYLARKLVVENYGLFTLAQTITGYFWLTVDLGTNMYGVKEIARDKAAASDIFNNLLTIRIVSGVLVFFLYTASLFFFKLSHIQIMTFIGCGMFLLTYSFYSDWVFNGLEKFQYLAFGTIVSGLCFLGGIILFVRSAEDAPAAAFVWSASFLISSVILLTVLSKKIGFTYKATFNLKTWLMHLKESIYFTLAGGMSVLYQSLPILLLSYFSSNYSVGLFSAPYRIVYAICTAGALLPMALYPILADTYKNNTRTFDRAQKMLSVCMLVLGLAISTAIFLGSAQIIYVLFGLKYASSVPVFRLLAALVCLIFTRTGFGFAIAAMNLQKQRAISTGAGLILATVLGMILIPRYDVRGAAVSLLAAEAFTLAIMIYIFSSGKRKQNKAACDR